MNTPIAFNCVKCGQPLQSRKQLHDGTVVCSKCGHKNTPPKGFTPPDSTKIKVKGIYFGD